MADTWRKDRWFPTSLPHFLLGHYHIKPTWRATIHVVTCRAGQIYLNTAQQQSSTRVQCEGIVPDAGFDMPAMRSSEPSTTFSCFAIPMRQSNGNRSPPKLISTNAAVWRCEHESWNRVSLAATLGIEVWHLSKHLIKWLASWGIHSGWG